MQAIEQFRARYPQGGLISEFLVREGGNYLVKVTVRADDMILATGLAAAEAIEIAEDRARQRALAAMGIGSLGNLSSVSPAAEAIAPPAPYTSAFPDLDLPQPNGISAPPAAANGTNGGTNGTNSKPADNPQPSFWEARAAAVALEPLEVPPAGEPAQPKPAAKAAKKRTTKAKKVEPTPDLAVAPTPAPTPAPEPTLDAAEIVTRAKAELKRLGWTREQGQKFLLTRYGKRETRQLDDREWRDFYDYLYQQPNPARSAEAM